MKRWRVYYLSKNNKRRLHRDFADYSEAVSFYALHGPIRATLWAACLPRIKA
jgi:tagatose-1,6-bisphosphate aldolase non-catalytic subunit AgaZ/GatZ